MKVVEIIASNSELPTLPMRKALPVISSEAETSLAIPSKNGGSSTSLGMTKVIRHNANVGRSDDKDTFMSSEGPAVLTGLANPAVIDLLGFDSKRGEVLLVMNESRPWVGGDEQLHHLQEKCNAYASFILDREMTSVHLHLAGKKTR